MLIVETFRDLWRLLDTRGRVLTCILVATLAVASAFEIVSMFFLFGFFSVLGAAEVGGAAAVVTRVYLFLIDGLKGTEFVIGAGAVLVGVFIIKNALWLLSSFAMLRFVMKRYEYVARTLFNGYQDMPLDILRSRGTLEPTHVLNSVLAVFRRGFVPLLQGAADMAVIVAMLITLMWLIDPVLVLVSAVVLGISAGVFLILTRRLSLTLGNRIEESQRALNRLTNEALRGLLDVRLAGRQAVMHSRFATIAGEFALADRRGRAIDMAPRVINELVLAAGIAVAASWFSASEGGLAGAIPTLAVLGFAGLRVTAALSRLLAAVQSLRQCAGARRILFAEIHANSSPVLSPRAKLSVRGEAPVQTIEANPDARLTREIRLEGVTYSYPNSEKPALSKIDLCVPAGSFAALCGPSGGGKSTLALLIMGLLQPQMGRVLCDNQDIRQGLSGWHAQIGYVGQDPYIMPRSIRENVAFALPPEQIDDDAVWQALETAAIADVVRLMPDGLGTIPGEDGTLFSGGQKQRFAIARALYGDPGVLVFDEATAALDTVTEREVSSAINRLRGYRTIIAIAHRLSTIDAADCIHLIEDGHVVASGNYAKLLRDSPNFRALAGIAQ